MIRAENEERQKAAQFNKGTSGNPTGKQARTKTCEPANRDHKAEHARSTVGQVAAKAGVSMHKARQAIAVLDAVEAGTVTPEAVAEVKAGKKKLRSVMPKKKKASAKKRRTMSALLVAIRDIIAEWKDADHNVEALKDELKTQIERL